MCVAAQKEIALAIGKQNRKSQQKQGR